MSAGAVGEYAFHVHHEKLYEKLTEPIENRLKYIESSKNQKEIPLRLKLMRVVKDQKKLGDLLKALEGAWKGWEKALGDTNTAYRKDRSGKTAESAEAAAEKAYAEALSQNQAIYALHKQECEPDCPWDPVQSTIFPKAARV